MTELVTDTPEFETVIPDLPASKWARWARWPRLPFPLVAALLVLAALVTVVVWAVSSPPGSSPDEDFHLGSIMCPRPADEFCEVQIMPDGEPAIWIPFQTAHANCNAPVSAQSAACFDELADYGYTWSTRFDTGYYPIGFFRIMHLMRNVGSNLADSVFTMRIVNGSLAVLLFTATALLFTHHNRRLMTYALLLVMAPMMLYLVVSINPSGWGIAGVCLAWLGLHGYLTERERWRRYGLLGVAAAGAMMAAAARGDAGLFVVLAVLAVVVLHWLRVWHNWRLALAPVAVAIIGLIGFLTSGQVASATEGLAEEGPGGFLLSNTLEMPAFLMDTVVGSLNWFDTPLPAVSRVPVIMAVAAVAFIGLRQVDIPKVLALLGLFFVLVALPLLILEVSGSQLGEYFQPRYLSPIIPLVMLTALWNPRTGKVQRFTRPQLWIIWAILVVGHAWALHTQILRFTHGLAIRWWNLNTAPEWWAFGISPMATWVIGCLAFALLTAAIFAVSGGHGTAADSDLVDFSETDPNAIGAPQFVSPVSALPEGA